MSSVMSKCDKAESTVACEKGTRTRTLVVLTAIVQNHIASDFPM